MASYPWSARHSTSMSSSPPAVTTPVGVKREREMTTRTPKTGLHLGKESQFLANHASYAPRTFQRTVSLSFHIAKMTTTSTPPTCVSNASANTYGSRSRSKGMRESAVRNAQSPWKSLRSGSLHQVGLIGSTLYLIVWNVVND